MRMADFRAAAELLVRHVLLKKLVELQSIEEVT